MGLSRAKKEKVVFLAYGLGCFYLGKLVTGAKNYVLPHLFAQHSAINYVGAPLSVSFADSSPRRGAKAPDLWLIAETD
jgi:hypothetical protein